MSEPTHTTTTKKLRQIRTYAEDLEIGKRKRDEKSGNGEEINSAELKIPETTKKPDPVPAKKEVNVAEVVANLKKPEPETLPDPATKIPPPDKAPSSKPPVVSIDQKTLDKFAPQKQSLTDTKKDNEFVIDSGTDDGATIITDNKRNRFRFFPAVKRALTDWFSNYQEEQRQKKIPKYVVPDAEIRKGVIQKATSKTGRFATSDFSSIQDRIRQREEYEKRMEHVTWTPNTDVGYSLLPGKVDTTSNVRLVHRGGYNVPAPEKVSPAVTKPKTTIRPAAELPVIAPEPKAKVPPPLPTPKAEAKIPTPTKDEHPEAKRATSITEAPYSNRIEQILAEEKDEIKIPGAKPTEASSIPKSATPEEEKPVKKSSLLSFFTKKPKVEKSEVEATKMSEPEKKVRIQKRLPEPVPTDETLEETEPETWDEEALEDYRYEDWERPREVYETETATTPTTRSWRILPLTTNVMTLGIVAVIAVIGVGVMIINTLLNQEETTAPIASEEMLAPLRLSNLPVEFVSLETVSGEAIQSEIFKLSGETKALVFVKPNPTREPIPSTALLNLLTDSSNAGILASLKQIYFGRTDLNEPFVMIKVSDEISARGGMLAWEKTLERDFTETFQLEPAVSATRFIDVTKEGADARILLDEANNELLTYGLINNMIIVTTDSLTFGELVKLIK